VQFPPQGSLQVLLTGAGIFGDLCLPDSPIRMFKPEPRPDYIDAHTELIDSQSLDEIRVSGEIDLNRIDRRSDSHA
jgi:hypothetical protein